MAQAHKAIREVHERKMCLACGYRGRLIQGERGLITFQCPSCGADLYARPPRSYAELEGFIAPPIERPIVLDVAPPPARPDHAARRLRRGLALERLLAWSLALTFCLVAGAGLLAAVV